MVDSDGFRAVGFAREASFGRPGSIKSVADFLLGEGTGIARLSMADIARRAYTSKPTLVRYAKKAGYAGWQDYRKDFLAEMGQLERDQREHQDVDVNYPFNPSATTKEIVASLAKIRDLSLREVERSLDVAALDSAAKAILNARDCLVLATLQNRRLGSSFAHNMSLMGHPIRVPQTEEAPPALRYLTPDDCIIAISYSGNLAQLPLSLVTPAVERGVPLVAITNTRHGELRGLADYALCFPPLEHYHDKIVGFYSESCVSFILDALFSSCYVNRYTESKQHRARIVSGLIGTITAELNE